ncbi:MAG: YceI family protein [Chloroflexota bacterium]|nr:YceI family protein [Chloroflexota bacterium]
MRGGLVRWLVVAALLGVVIAGVAYLVVFITGGTGEASEPISAPRLALPTATAAPPTPTPIRVSEVRLSTPTAQAATPAATPPPTAAATRAPAATPAATPTPVATATPAATPTPVATAAPVATEAPAGDVPTSAVLYRIVPEESEVRFEIDEILRGAPTLVVGTTNQVAGDFIIDFADLAASQLGTMRINVRTLRTDEERRDRAIRSRILESASDQYEFTTFEPVRLNGLPGSIELGQIVVFQIVGNLAIRDITREVTFLAELTVVSPDRVEGTAVTTILREDYSLTIPNVPFVASVDEDVLLAITFVAVAVPQ